MLVARWLYDGCTVVIRLNNSCTDVCRAMFSVHASAMIYCIKLRLFCHASVHIISSLKSQVVYSKQPKLGLTQEFVVDCAHALWVVHSIKRLI